MEFIVTADEEMALHGMMGCQEPLRQYDDDGERRCGGWRTRHVTVDAWLTVGVAGWAHDLLTGV
jgi:hypothetical protein